MIICFDLGMKSLFLFSALVHFYAKCDPIVEAKKVFSSMEMHDQVWIVGFSTNGQGRDAFFFVQRYVTYPSQTQLFFLCHCYY